MSLAERIAAIERDREHGASWLSREAIIVIKLVAEESQANSADEFLEELKSAAKRLSEARPTMVAIQNLISRFVYQVAKKSETERNLNLLKSFASDIADKLARDSEAVALKVASLASEIIADGDWIMSCSYSSTICRIFRLAKDKGNRFHIVVAKSRSGGRAYGELTARELQSLGLIAEVIPDSLIADNMPRIDKVMVGADAILRDGSLINGTPTYQVALAAKSAWVPFYTIGETTKLAYQSYGESPLEKGFDLIPSHLITGIITEVGIIKPEEVYHLSL